MAYTYAELETQATDQEENTAIQRAHYVHRRISDELKDTIALLNMAQADLARAKSELKFLKEYKTHE